MNQQLKDARESVNPGWWAILDTYIPQILDIDPEAHIEVKEKFGTLRIWVGSETVEDCSVFDPYVQAAEETSKTVCEICGSPGQLQPKQRWIQTLCDRCAALAPDVRYRIGQEIGAQIREVQQTGAYTEMQERKINL